jgi:hypothetical protein
MHVDGVKAGAMEGRRHFNVGVHPARAGRPLSDARRWQCTARRRRH